MEYDVIFEMRTSGIGVLWFPLAGVAIAGVGVVLLGHVRSQPNVIGPMRTFIGVFRVFFVSFALLWAVLAYFAVGPSQSKLRKTYEAGSYQVVEGRVSHFNPDPRGLGNERAESFRVGDLVFEYHYYRPSISFKHTAYHGGPIKEGLQVRVTYIGDAIVKLEVPAGANK